MKQSDLFVGLQFEHLTVTSELRCVEKVTGKGGTRKARLIQVRCSLPFLSLVMFQPSGSRLTWTIGSAIPQPLPESLMVVGLVQGKDREGPEIHLLSF